MGRLSRFAPPLHPFSANAKLLSSLSVVCNSLIREIYSRVMSNGDIAQNIDEAGLGESLRIALEGMSTWTNSIVVPELQKSGMNPPNVEAMQLEVIAKTMNDVLKSKMADLLSFEKLQPTQNIIAAIYCNLHNI